MVVITWEVMGSEKFHYIKCWWLNTIIHALITRYWDLILENKKIAVAFIFCSIPGRDLGDHSSPLSFSLLSLNFCWYTEKWFRVSFSSGFEFIVTNQWQTAQYTNLFHPHQWVMWWIHIFSNGIVEREFKTLGRDLNTDGHLRGKINPEIIVTFFFNF